VAAVVHARRAASAAAVRRLQAPSGSNERRGAHAEQNPKMRFVPEIR